MNAPTVTTQLGVFNFLKLPSELRNRIYQLHLSKKGMVNYEDDDFRPYEKPVRRLCLGVYVLQDCKQIYNEAVPFAYANRV